MLAKKDRITILTVLTVDKFDVTLKRLVEIALPVCSNKLSEPMQAALVKGPWNVGAIVAFLMSRPGFNGVLSVL
jgi:hypothetical protein